MTYHFEERLAWSFGQRQESDLETIKELIPGCASVRVGTVAEDRAGIDYVAVLRRGAEIFIDAKNRSAGCSGFWTNGPELALEIWSVMPDGGSQGKTGWTLDEAKRTDMVLFGFDASDSDVVYLVGFQSLRIAFRNNIREWMEQFKVSIQQSDGWKSQSIFVPAAVVLNAIRTESIGQRKE